MAFTWAAKRRVGVIAVIFFGIGLFGGFYWYLNRKPPSCMDQKKNQNETGIDCGGPCVPCLSEVKDIVILWTRFFELKPGFVDAAALIENPNDFFGTRELSYTFYIFDADNVRIAIRAGSIVVRPGERIVIFEPEISVQNRTSTRVFIELQQAAWEKQDARVLRISIERLTPLLENTIPPNEEFYPHLEARVKNDSDNLYENIAVTAVLWKGDQVMGVSRTIIDRIDTNEVKNLTFTWPQSIAGVERAELFYRNK